MIDLNRHKFFLVQILKDIYTDIELANYLGFKGGTALMFFYDLPRFSVDLDFNLLDVKKEDIVYRKVRKILLKYGTIFDEAKKFYGPIIVLDYGFKERKLKVEISTRLFDNRYEIKNLLGINMKVMVQEDMFAHKLCALLDRNVITNRDIFDCWFFMQKQTPVNKSIVESRMEMPFTDYLQKCIEHLESISNKGLLHGMGELMDNKIKKNIQVKMRPEVIELLKFYKKFPIL
ncbi:MAG: nucleotidyl transferase AbiEii/AbiGii toxin family protein [Bacteroidales bacterium]|jgi:predicted nucleotidyltransferase component of viral defense system|nr:nucleotidyl transferase AbiEii/AbiGii toxin family protein [Bacteroidales bacterium]